MFAPSRSPTITHTIKNIYATKGYVTPPPQNSAPTSWCHIPQVCPPPLPALGIPSSLRFVQACTGDGRCPCAHPHPAAHMHSASPQSHQPGGPQGVHLRPFVGCLGDPLIQAALPSPGPLSHPQGCV